MKSQEAVSKTTTISEENMYQYHLNLKDIVLPDKITSVYLPETLSKSSNWISSIFTIFMLFRHKHFDGFSGTLKRWPIHIGHWHTKS